MVFLAVGTDSILCAFLAILVLKTTAGTDEFATTCVLCMPKTLTFETTQGNWDERFNWYIKVISYDGWRKDGSKVRIKVFVGNSSLFRLTFILLTDVTPCEDKCSHISSSLTPSNSLHLMTPFDELREACEVILP